MAATLFPHEILLIFLFCVFFFVILPYNADQSHKLLNEDKLNDVTQRSQCIGISLKVYDTIRFSIFLKFSWFYCSFLLLGFQSHHKEVPSNSLLFKAYVSTETGS